MARHDNAIFKIKKLSESSYYYCDAKNIYRTKYDP